MQVKGIEEKSLSALLVLFIFMLFYLEKKGTQKRDSCRETTCADVTRPGPSSDILSKF